LAGPLGAQRGLGLGARGPFLKRAYEQTQPTAPATSRAPVTAEATSTDWNDQRVTR
jgi:hypothetical protein